MFRLLSFMMMLNLIFSLAARADSVQMYTLDNAKASQVELDCLNAEIKLIEEPGTQLKVSTQVFENQKPYTSSDWRVSLSKDAVRDVFKIHCVYPERAITDKKLPTTYHFVITLKGPSPRDLSVHARAGKLDAVGWTSPAHIVFENGAVTLKNTSGNINIGVIKGSIDVQKHTGKLRAELFEGKLSLLQVDGNLDLTNFNGTSNLKTINGDITYNSRNGTMTMETSQGSLKFDSDLGKIDINNFDGAVDGVTDQAQIIAKLQNPARFRVKIKNANVRLAVPSSSGAQVSMALNEGQFQVPSYLNQDTYGAVKTAKGTLRGGESGRITVTGEAGKVSLSTF